MELHPLSGLTMDLDDEVYLNQHQSTDDFQVFFVYL